ncbi:GroES-like protein [Phaeosphaeriaceae sp. SRC1lsM3a]|nr:GroES-like protein [Stagonospora sp. SRC1lsM3a]
MPDKVLAQVQRLGTENTPHLVVEHIPVPKPANHEVLVKVAHAGQNPTDVQSLDSNAFGDGAVLGCDFVGTVEEIGEEVTKAAKGDVVAGLIWGAGEIKGLGAYSQYSIANESISFKVPQSITLAEASTVPLASATAWLALFSKDSLHMDRRAGKDTSILVWGGSSSVGLYAIQFAALHGFKVITTCSPRHFDRVKSLGADYAFDYRAEDVASSIKKVVPGLSHVFDTIGASQSSATASQAVGEQGGVLCTVRPGKANTESVTERTKVTDVLVWTAFLKDHRYGDFFWPASKDDHELASELFEKLPTWLETGIIKPSVPKLLGGLDAVPAGFQEYRDGKVSGYKIVYKLDDGK